MNVYEYTIIESEDPSLNGRVLAFAKTLEDAESQLRTATINGARYLTWGLTKTTTLRGIQ